MIQFYIVTWFFALTSAAMAADGLQLELVNEHPAPAWAAEIEPLLGQTPVDVLIEIREPRSTGGLARAQESLRRETAVANRAAAQALALRGMEIAQTFEYLPLLRVRVRREDIATLVAQPDVVAVYPQRFYRRDAMLDVAPQLTRTTVDVGADKAWARGFRGQGFAIAVIDDGFNRDHEMLRGKIIAESCFSDSVGGDSLCPGGAKRAEGAGAASLCPPALPLEEQVCGHGSHVAGIAAGDNRDPSAHVRGVAPDANIVAVQVFHRARNALDCFPDPACLLASNFDLVGAMDWIIANAARYSIVAVNLSLGGGQFSDYCDDTSEIAPAVRTLRSMGIFTIIAAGNGGYVGRVSQPGCIKTALTISSVNGTAPDLRVNQAAMVDMLAPGVDVRSADAPGPKAYAVHSGTSMAAPHVAGAVAVLRSKLPAATPDQVEYALKAGGPSVSFPSWTWTTPRLAVDAALDLLGGQPPPGGVAMIGLLAPDRAPNRSFVRLVNTGFYPGSATVALVANEPRKVLGSVTISVPGNTTRQLALADVADAAGLAAARSPLTAYVDALFKGFAQHVVLAPAARAVSNATVCTSLGIDAHNFISDVYAPSAVDSASRILLHNAGSRPWNPVIEIYDAANGKFLAAARPSVAIAADVTRELSSQAVFEAAGQMLPNAATTVNLRLLSPPTGTVQHMVDNRAAGLSFDMSYRCPLP